MNRCAEVVIIRHDPMYFHQASFGWTVLRSSSMTPSLETLIWLKPIESGQGCLQHRVSLSLDTQKYWKPACK